MQRGLQKANLELHLTQERLKAELAENEVLRGELREQAIRDSLTGLFNRRYLQERLEQEVARADRENSPISILFLDIDHFKQFNDTFGHHAGDLLLQEFGALLQQKIRKSDTACRYGGEEFLIVMSDISLPDAVKSAELLRAEFEKRVIPFQDGQTLRATISIGVASYPENGRTIPEVIQAADVALYAAKSAGRNRVETPKTKRPV
jgi:diguanylate cyclase (GGDEF)-like protein